MRQVETRRRMTALVRRWQASRDTQAVFAARHGVTRTKLRYWLRRVGGRVADDAIAFAPVQVLGAPSAETGEVDVVLATGERMVVRAGASADLVRTVLSALRSDDTVLTIVVRAGSHVGPCSKPHSVREGLPIPYLWPLTITTVLTRIFHADFA